MFLQAFFNDIFSMTFFQGLSARTFFQGHVFQGHFFKHLFGPSRIFGGPKALEFPRGFFRGGGGLRFSNERGKMRIVNEMEKTGRVLYRKLCRDLYQIRLCRREYAEIYIRRPCDGNAVVMPDDAKLIVLGFDRAEILG